jgi:hypothetical protein
VAISILPQYICGEGVAYCIRQQQHQCDEDAIQGILIVVSNGEPLMQGHRHVNRYHNYVDI